MTTFWVENLNRDTYLMVYVISSIGGEGGYKQFSFEINLVLQKQSDQ